MRKVILFALTAAIALGCLVFAHAAVSESQDDLLVYPTLEIGDPSILEGMTASMTFACGDHLRWYTDYTFGGGTETEFAYSGEGFAEPAKYTRSRLEVCFTSGMSASISGGSFSLGSSDYGALFRAVAVTTPVGESRTMNLKMADYVDYYRPDYELFYEDRSRICQQSYSHHSQITGDDWFEGPGNYEEFLTLFRFPVQEDHIMSVTVEKDDAGRICAFELYPENGPELHFVSDVNGDGIWFVIVFRDEDGAPLSYESPQGHGIYYVPWKSVDTVHYGDREQESLLPDLEKAERLVPLADSLAIRHMKINAEQGVAWMLTLEEEGYVLTFYDLTTGTTAARLPVLPHDPEETTSDGWFTENNGHILVTAQGNIALVDAASRELVLTAPDAAGQTYSAPRYSAANGDLRFDGEHLILIDTTLYREGTFWTAIYRQGEQVYYGEYDCSLMRGNDDWAYGYITVDQDPIGLK